MSRSAASGPRLAAAALLAVAIAVSLPGCGSAKVETVVLAPETFETFRSSHSDVAEWSCWPFGCAGNYWYGSCEPSSDPPGAVLVGTVHQYDNGTLPCNCWKRRDCFYRGAVRFDLSQFAGKTILGATLSWDERGECVAKMYISSNSWPTWNKPPGPIISDPWASGSSGAGEVPVGQTVQDWVAGNTSNFGWIFVGPEETKTHGSAQIGGGSGSSCPSAIGGLKLEVVYVD